MIYRATVKVQDGHFILMEFPDLPGCQTFVDLNVPESRKPYKVAKEALEGHVQTLAMLGKPVPKPSYSGPGMMVDLSGSLEKLIRDCGIWK